MRPASFGVSSLDLSATLRGLRSRPAFTVAAVSTLALGIGATTAVSSLVDTLLLRPLPYREPDRLVAIWPGQAVANRELDLVRSRAASLSQVAGWSPGWLMTLTGVDLPRQLNAARVSGNMFDLLGARPIHGRIFGLEAETAGQDKDAVLGYPVWQAAWNGDPGVVGRTIALNGDRYLVVGVMPEGFELLSPGTDLWTPLTIDRDEFTWSGPTELLFGRLRAGVSPKRATAEIGALARVMEAEFAHPAGWGRDARVVGLHEHLVRGARSMVWLLFGAVAFLLLIAATNVANLLLVRTAERGEEIAVRASLGASSARIAGLLVTESVFIGFLGGALGVAIAIGGVELLRVILPRSLPRLGELVMDSRILAAAAGLTLATVLGFGLAPAGYAIRSSIGAELREGRGASRAGGRLRGALVAAEVALALVLLTGAALMSRTMMSLARVDPGLRADRLLTARVQPSADSTAELVNFWREALARIEALPGVISAGTILHLPTSGRSWMANIEVEGRPLLPGTAPPRAAWQSVSARYFETAGVPLLAGRSFDQTDRREAPRVIVVNAAFAARLFPVENAVGRRIKAGSATAADWATVIGVVGSVRHDILTAEPAPEVYVSFEQTPVFGTSLVVRTRGEPTALAPIVRERIWSVNPDVPVVDLRTMEDRFSASLQRPRMILTLLGLFAAIGTVLGAVGVYGVVAFGVRQRRRELGIRAALGADLRSLVRLVMASGLRAVAAGLLIGIPAALGLASVMRRFTFGIAPIDPVSFALVPLLMAAVALLASWLPARRAAATNPTIVLRE